MSPSLKPTTEPDKAAEPDRVRLRLFRFDPVVDRAPRYESYEVPYQPRMRIIDVLDFVHENLAVDFGYRWLCGSKKCGSCAVKVNGTPKLACWDPAEPEMTIEPLANTPLIRDLVVSRDAYEADLAKMSPTLVRGAQYTEFPEALTAIDMAPAKHLRECIQCLSCQSVCPVLAQQDTAFAGPAPLVALAELALDPRDAADRATYASRQAHVFKCVSCYACEDVCPVGIPIVADAIEPLKRLAYAADPSSPGARRARTLLDIVKSRGRVNGAALALKTKSIGLDELKLAIRMLKRGKINLADTFLKQSSVEADVIRKVYDSSERTE